MRALRNNADKGVCVLGRLGALALAFALWAGLAVSPAAAQPLEEQSFTGTGQEQPDAISRESQDALEPLTSEDEQRHAGPNDPIEDVNRYFFEVNLFLDDILLEPMARGYRLVVPGPGRQAVGNFINNLDSPIIFSNDVLQGEFGRAGTTAARFSINSTLGILGLFDPAKSFGLVRHGEDFGQTLAVYGANEGPFLMIPVLGPAPPRDLAGRVVDQVFDPLTWVGWQYKEEVALGKTALGIIDARERNIETFDEIERTSIDFYAQVRSLYRQQRASEIKNGREDFDDLPDLSEFGIE